MNAPLAPWLDRRTPEDIAAQVRGHLGWPAEHQDPLGEALIAVFAHYAGQLVQGLNAAPQRQLEAFVDLLRPGRLEAVPARTVLVFNPVARPGIAGARTVLPAGTAAIGPVPAGAREPVVFETLAPLTLSSARLARAFVSDAGSRRWADAAAVSTPAGLAPDALAAAAEVPWSLQFALPDSLVLTPTTQLRLRLEIEAGGSATPPEQHLEWFVRGESGPLRLVPVSDSTAGLGRSGELVFAGLPDWPATLQAGRAARWLGCRCVGAGAAAARPALLRDASLRARTELTDSPLEAAFFGKLPLDPSRDFFPLGEQPRFGDSFVIQAAALAQPNAQLRLEVRLTNPAEGSEATPIPPVATERPAQLQWEAWTTLGWTRLAQVSDGTRGLTRNGSVRFTLPADSAPTTYQGQSGGFVRAWLAGGDYQLQSRAASLPAGPGGTALPAGPPLHRPPAVARLLLNASLQSPEFAVETIVEERALQSLLHARAATAGFSIVLQGGEPAAPAALYLGLQRPAGAAPASERLQFVLQVDGDGPGDWQYRSRQGHWVDAPCSRLPSAATEQPALALEPGPDWSEWPGSTVDPKLHWLRRIGKLPQRVWLNAVPALQRQGIEDEVLGSSSGQPGQSFRLAQAPVLGEPVFEVCEPGRLPEREHQALVDAGGADAVRIEPALGRLGERSWVRWQRVADFGASGPQSRHYMLDAQDGRLVLGDGRRGRIPPSGPNNLVMRRYHCGGGAAGNLPAGSVNRLRTSYPYVESVAQPQAAAGGQDAEAPAVARAAAIAGLRHRGRAVGPDDFEDLACRASPEVLRARCLSARDLVADPLGRQLAPGSVSLALLPGDSGEPMPRPGQVLVGRVLAFMAERGAAGARIVVGAPYYVPIDTEVELLPRPEADPERLARDCEQRIADFLHPARGGSAGLGWPFARWPHISELRAALKGLPGLAEVRQLRLHAVESRPGALALPHALACAGRCRIRLAA